MGHLEAVEAMDHLEVMVVEAVDMDQDLDGLETPFKPEEAVVEAATDPSGRDGQLILHQDIVEALPMEVALEDIVEAPPEVGDLLEALLMEVALEGVSQCQNNNAELCRSSSVEMCPDKNVQQSIRQNVPVCQNNNVEMFRSNNAKVFQDKNVQLCLDRNVLNNVNPLHGVKFAINNYFFFFYFCYDLLWLSLLAFHDLIFFCSVIGLSSSQYVVTSPILGTTIWPLYNKS